MVFFYLVIAILFLYIFVGCPIISRKMKRAGEGGIKFTEYIDQSMLFALLKVYLKNSEFQAIDLNEQGECVVFSKNGKYELKLKNNYIYVSQTIKSSSSLCSIKMTAYQEKKTLTAHLVILLNKENFIK